MQTISNDKTVTSITVQHLIDFKSQSLETQAKKVEQLVPIMPAMKKAFDLMGDDIIELASKKLKKSLTMKNS